MVHKVKIIQYLGYLTIIFGIGMVLYPILLGSSDLILLLSATYGEVENMGPGFELYLGFSLIAGGLTIALGFFITYVGKNYNPDDQYLVYFGLAIWFVIDTIASLFYAWEYNVILNLLILGIMLMVFTKTYKDTLFDERVEDFEKQE